jgi:hypothetical protein
MRQQLSGRIVNGAGEPPLQAVDGGDDGVRNRLIVEVEGAEKRFR